MVHRQRDAQAQQESFKSILPQEIVQRCAFKLQYECNVLWAMECVSHLPSPYGTRRERLRHGLGHETDTLD